MAFSFRTAFHAVIQMFPSDLSPVPGARVERARLEEKCVNKKLVPLLSTLRMSSNQLHGNDNRSLMYECYVLIPEAAEETSWFLDAWLLRRRATLGEAEWLAPADFFIAVSEPGQSSTMANLSLEKRAAQLLGGEDVPKKLLESLVIEGHPSAKPLLRSGDSVMVLHTTPYDACLERVCLKKRWPVCSPSLHSPDSAQVCQMRLAKQLLLDWKSGDFTYMPAPQLLFSGALPQEEEDKVQGPDIPVLELLHLDHDSNNITIPTDVRKKWASDPVYSHDWVNELKKIDTWIAAVSTSATTTEPPSEEAAPVLVTADAWQPKSRETLQGTIHSFAGHIANSEYILHETGGATELYIHAKGDAIRISNQKPLFETGNADWIRPPASTRLLANPGETMLHTFVLQDDSAPAPCLKSREL